MLEPASGRRPKESSQRLNALLWWFRSSLRLRRDILKSTSGTKATLDRSRTPDPLLQPQGPIKLPLSEGSREHRCYGHDAIAPA